MKKIRFLVAAAVVAFAIFDMAQPASAARSWKDWVNSGYCPVGTCNLLGGWRASNVRNCRAAHCRVRFYSSFSGGFADR